MEQNNCLGLYISKHKATAVLLSGHGAKPSVLGCFSVTVEADDEHNSFAAPLASEIAAKINSRQMKFESVSVALDCSMFTQHDLRSAFTDHRQIANTIKFDAEEAVGADATELAVTFSIISTDDAGARVNVFASDIHAMTDLLGALQANGMDPTAMEPDVICAARSLEKNIRKPNGNNCIFTIVGSKACYIIHPSQGHDPATRTFLVSHAHDITTTLAREIPITIAAMNTGQPIKSLMLDDSTNNVDCDVLTQRTSLDIGRVDLMASTGANPSILDENTAPSDFSIAYGAALAELKKTGTTDFRQDFMPYQGRKMLIERSLRIMSVSMTVVLLAIGAYFQLNANWKNQDANTVQEKTQKDYAAIMAGKEHTSKEAFSSKLARIKNTLEKRGSGQMAGDDRSVAATITFVLEALNSDLLKGIKIDVDSIGITNKSIKLSGSTTSRRNALEFFKAIDEHPRLKKVTDQIKPSGSRFGFTVNIELN